MSGWLETALYVLLAVLVTGGLLWGSMWLSVWIALSRIDQNQWPTTEWEWGKIVLYGAGSAILVLAAVFLWVIRDARIED